MAFDYSDPNLRRPIFGPGAGFGGVQAQSFAPQRRPIGRSEPTPRQLNPLNRGPQDTLPTTPPTTPPPTPNQIPRPQYYGGGNIGNSAPGSRSPTGNPAMDPTAPGYEYQPWMEDTSIQWGGGPHGYLPIGYQPQDFGYYGQMQQGGNVAQGPWTQAANGRWRPSGGYAQMAPWEQAYARDTWTQNYDPTQPGFIDPTNPNSRG